MPFKDLSEFNLYEKQIDLVEQLFDYNNTIITKAADTGCDYAVALYLTLRALKPKIVVNRNSSNVVIVAPNLGGGQKILNYIRTFLNNISIEFKSTEHKIKLPNSVVIEVVSSSQYALVGRIADIIYISNLSMTRNAQNIFDNAFEVVGTSGQLVISSRINKRNDVFDQLLKDPSFDKVEYKWAFNPNNDVDKLMQLIDNLQFSVLCQDIYCKYVDSPLK